MRINSEHRSIVAADIEAFARLERGQRGSVGRTLRDLFTRSLERAGIGQADLFVLVLDESGAGRWQSREIMAAIENYWDAPDKRFVVIADRQARIPALLQQRAMILSQGTPEEWVSALDDADRWFARYQIEPEIGHPAASYQDRVDRIGHTTSGSPLAISELDRCRDACRRQLADQIRRLGPGHPDTAATLHRWAMASAELGGLPEARALLERALELRTAVLGPGDLATAASAYNLGLVLWRLGELPQARALLTRAYEASLGTLGADAPETLEAERSLRALTGDG
jgi:tetratricopeptide (TPR) repeat protein